MKKISASKETTKETLGNKKISLIKEEKTLQRSKDKIQRRLKKAGPWPTLNKIEQKIKNLQILKKIKKEECAVQNIKNNFKKQQKY